jgi:hypothetical protein
MEATPRNNHPAFDKTIQFQPMMPIGRFGQVTPVLFFSVPNHFFLNFLKSTLDNSGYRIVALTISFITMTHPPNSSGSPWF